MQWKKSIINIERKIVDREVFFCKNKTRKDIYNAKIKDLYLSSLGVEILWKNLLKKKIPVALAVKKKSQNPTWKTLFVLLCVKCHLELLQSIYSKFWPKLNELSIHF